MIKIIEEIANFKVKKKHLIDKPLGVRGRSSNNDLIRKKLNWDTELTLKEGLEKTYEWIYNQIANKSNISKFTISY